MQRAWLLPLICLLITRTRALVNVASVKPYTVDPVGFHEVVFRSHNNTGYRHISVLWEDSGQLTNDVSPVSFPSRLWFNQTHNFNVSVTIDLQTPAAPREALIQGPCCNMGIYTPVAAYLFGSTSADGPWAYLGESSGLVSGDDAATPALRYEMHFLTADQSTLWRFVRVIATGQNGRYMSIRQIQILA